MAIIKELARNMATNLRNISGNGSLIQAESIEDDMGSKRNSNDIENLSCMGI